MIGFYRIALCAPKLRVADVASNAKEIERLYKECGRDAAVVCFPELSLTSYSCADLFNNASLIEAARNALLELRDATKSSDAILVVGAPLVYANRCYNCAVVIQRGEIVGVVPKTFIPNYKEFYERRWFASGADIKGASLRIGDRDVAFGTDLIFEDARQVCFGVEICEDLWTFEPPSIGLARAGAQLLLNLSASNELVGKADYRRTLVSSQSARLSAAYAYVSCGPSESTTDVIYSGHRLVAENGALLVDERSQNFDSAVSICDVDLFKIAQLRRSETNYSADTPAIYRRLPVIIKDVANPNRSISRLPFVPQESGLVKERSREILSLQSMALARRAEHIKSKCMVLGLSGGLDSTLALLACLEAQTYLTSKIPILAISMPGFGTSEQTRKAAQALAKAVGVNFKEIDITEACKKHLADIGHDGEKQDLTFENAQARERTQILMDLSNKEQGFVVGTGDLSELALGWSTFNGDHISMYHVNCGVPKTLVRHLISWYAEERSNKDLAGILQSILDTPVSPELLKSDGKVIAQKTEEIIGPYIVLDFYLFQFLRYGSGPKRILELARIAFKSEYSDKQLKDWLILFGKRFFGNQFKRNCMPDGPKIGTIALSPRGDWRMPSDATADTWLAELDT